MPKFTSKLRKPARRPARRLQIETLESRQMLSATYPALDLAKLQLTTASSSGGDTAPTEATDGIVSNDSRWFASGSGPHWLEVELPVAYPIGSAQLFLGLDDTLTVDEFEIQVHDGGSWQTVVDVTANVATDLNLVFPEPIEDATRFRFFTMANEARVKEFSLLPPAGPTGHALGTDLNLNLASQRGPTGTSSLNTNHALNAVDGWVDDASRWLSNGNGGTTHRLQVDIPTIHAVGSIHLYSGFFDGSNDNSPIANFSLEYASGSGWQPAMIGSATSGTVTGNSISGNASNELIIELASPVMANKVRLNFDGGYGRIREMVVFPANLKTDGTSGYPLGAGVQFAAPPAESYTDFGDDWYRIASRLNNNSLVTTEVGSSQANNQTPDEAKRFQVLYSYASNAFRLRNQDTGRTIEVQDASMQSGAAIVEGDFSAAPHQLWNLKATDGGYFTLTNVWSGMALQTDGGAPAAVTQQPLDESSNPADSQEWLPAFQDDYFKKGTGGWVGQYGTGWAYNWARNGSTLGKDQFYAPMQHREGWPNLNTLHKKYHPWNNVDKQSVLLGFNEPDRPEQANMSVARAIELWPQLMALDVPLVSPAPAQGGEDWWLNNFFNQADDLGYRNDYSAGHWYSAPNVGNLFNHINDLQNRGHGRDVWLTEFSVVDWSGGSGNWSEEDNYNFILEFLWRAETKNNLDKYALFLFSGGVPQNPWTKSNPRSNFFSGGGLTAFGKAYAAWDGDTQIDDQTAYLIHNRFARHRVQNDGSSTPGFESIRHEDVSLQWSMADAGNGRKYLISLVDGSRLGFDGTSLEIAAPGTSGPNVEWQIQHEQYGWHNILHPATDQALRLARTNDSNGAPTSQNLEMVPASNAASFSTTDWWFVKPHAAVSAELPGDFNGDFTYGVADLDLLTQQIAEQTHLTDFDLTEDNLVDLQDQDEWLRIAGSANLGAGFSYFLGDANLDAAVDGQDFILWNDNKFTQTSKWSNGDFNADGAVDGQDFILWNEMKFQIAGPRLLREQPDFQKLLAAPQTGKAALVLPVPIPDPIGRLQSLRTSLTDDESSSSKEELTDRILAELRRHA